MKYFLLLSFLTFQISYSNEGFPPEAIQSSIKEHCEGNVVAIKKDRIKGLTVFAVFCKEDKQKTAYYFTESGRLIHSKESSDHDEEEHDEEEHDEEEHDEEEHDEEEHDEILEVEIKDISEQIRKNILAHVKSENAYFGVERTIIIKNKEGTFFIFNHSGELIDEYENEEKEDDDLEGFQTINYDDLPGTIKKHINKDLKEDIDHIWEETLYYAKEETDDVIVLYTFDSQGKLIDKEIVDEEDFDENIVDIDYDELPNNIHKAIKKYVKGEHHSYGRELIFFVEAEENNETVYYIFNEHGKLLERETEYEDE